MALRSFQDEQGRMWQVWSVRPFVDDVTAAGSSVGDGPVLVRGGQRQRLNLALDAHWAAGWLTFETPGEKRRLAPWPTDWTGLTERELLALCTQAELVRPTRAEPINR